MRLSSKARSLVMRAYNHNRPIAVLDEDTERDLMASGLVRYSTRPLMVLTREGHMWAKNRKGIEGHG